MLDVRFLSIPTFNQKMGYFVLKKRKWLQLQMIVIKL